MAATFGAVAKKVATGVGAPSYTSGVHMWNGTAEILNASPASTKLRPNNMPSDRSLPEIRSEEHTSELQSLMRISYAVFCLKKKKAQNKQIHTKIVTHKQPTDNTTKTITYSRNRQT